MSTRIPYLNEVWNIVTGCGDEKVSPGCAHCYARAMTGRNLWGYDFAPRFHADRLDDPRHWKRPRRIGVTFMGDLWHEGIDDEERWAVYEVMEECRRHTFVDLTKRTKERHDFLRSVEDVNDGWPLRNLWQGSTICNQQEADRDIPILLDTPAAVRFVSVEPMLGAVDMQSGWWIPPLGGGPKCNVFRPWETPPPSLDWVILGGETGPGARPMQPEWALDVWRQCKAAGVPFFFKQWGSSREIDVHQSLYGPDILGMTSTREFPAAHS